MNNCLFCKIANKEIPAHIIYEDGDTIGILDITPRAPGHTMVIPKVHGATILEVQDATIVSLFGAVKKVTALLQKALAPDGFTIGINHGRASGQAVDHLHIHVIPRWLTDGGGSVHSVVNNPPQESLDAIKEKILKAAGGRVLPGELTERGDPIC